MPRGGSKPKPARLLQLQGTYQKTRHDRRANEPQCAAGLADWPVPPWLTLRQRQLWTEFVGTAPAGVLQSADWPLLASYCVHVDLLRDAAELQARAELVGVDGRPSPYLRIARQTTDVLVKIAAQLGFCPVSRAQLGTPLAPAELPEDTVWRSLGRFPRLVNGRVA
jgi:phage terminase small subunit